jgi:ubiquitin C-terminal hydrolase
MVVPKAIELLYPPALKQQQLYDEPKLEGLYDVGPRMFMNLIAPDRIQGKFYTKQCGDLV